MELFILESIRTFVPAILPGFLFGLPDEFTWALLSALAASAVTAAIPGAWRALQSRYVHRFWRPLIDGRISIVMSEYSNEMLTGDDPTIALVRKLGIRHFVSKGNALALATIMQFLSRDLKFHEFGAHGDKTLQDDANDNLILIGSPATNVYSEWTFRSIKETFDISFDVSHDASNIRIVDVASGKVYEAKIDEHNNGVDYALVVRAHLSGSENRCCLLLCGASQWGVEGAAKVVTTRRLLRKVSRALLLSNDVAFIVKVDVFNNAAHNPEILRVGLRRHRYVRPLKKTRPG